jgi:hypothetical protein
MTNLNPDSLDGIIDDVKHKRMKANYGAKGTRAELIKTWIIADVYLAVLRHIGLTEYDGRRNRRIKDMNSRRMAEFADMVERHWDRGICLPESILNAAIKEAIEHAKNKGELKDESLPLVEMAWS